MKSNAIGVSSKNVWALFLDGLKRVIREGAGSAGVYIREPDE